jgi:NADH:ubiquinone oxidoreductase subunit 6 (subunit J)
MTALQIIFLITAIVTFASAVMVVTARNLVHAALALVASLFGVAVLFALLEAGFLAVVQVTLYIGAIAILIIFAIMLTRRVMQDTGPQHNGQWLAGAVISFAMFLVLAWVVLQIPSFTALSTMPVTLAPVPADSLALLGRAFVDPAQYAIPFEVASVMLLVAFIGAIVIAGDKK